MHTKTQTLAAAVEQVMTQDLAEFLARNRHAIAQQLAEAVDGQMSVSVSFKLNRTATHLGCSSRLGFSKRFTDEEQNSVALGDPDQLTMPGVVPPENGTRP